MIIVMIIIIICVQCNHHDDDDHHHLYTMRQISSPTNKGILGVGYTLKLQPPHSVEPMALFDLDV